MYTGASNPNRTGKMGRYILGLALPLVSEDNWMGRSDGMRCWSCIFFVPKSDEDGDDTNLGRCRRHAPTLGGWPAVFETDWCGDHKLNENSGVVSKVNILNQPVMDGVRRLRR